jgi:hypothetical protein
MKKMADLHLIPTGRLVQLGLKKIPPAVDSWGYFSKRFMFRFENLDEEVYDFLTSNERIASVLLDQSSEIEYASFTLTPTGASFDDGFSCYIKNATLKKMVDLGLSFEIAPEEWMPEFPFWIEKC